MDKEHEVDVWNDDRSEWETGKIVDTNGGLRYVEYDDGRTDWVCDFEVERRNW